MLPVEASRDRIVPSLQRNGYDVTFHEFDGGRQIPGEIAREALDWLIG